MNLFPRVRSRRLIYRIAVGCTLAATTIVGTTLASVTPATANTCDTNHARVNGRDQGNSGAYGNKGWIYVNTDSVIDSLHNDISRSLFIYGPAGYNVEVGWQAHNPSTNPEAYAEWEINGSTVEPQVDPNSNGQNLTTDTNFRFRVENLGDVGIWRFVFSNDSSPFDYSPAMPFNWGTPHVQAERYNDCDSLYTHMYDLSYEINNTPDWSGSYGNLECWVDETNTWFFHKNSDSDFDVTLISSSCP